MIYFIIISLIFLSFNSKNRNKTISKGIIQYWNLNSGSKIAYYFFEGKGISLEEAYRFLLNRWLEKKLLAQKKKEAGAVTEVAIDTLVVKKRKGKLKK